MGKKCECSNNFDRDLYVFQYMITYYREERKKLRREAGKGMMRMERLLGDPRIIKHTLEYIEESGRLDT